MSLEICCRQLSEVMAKFVLVARRNLFVGETAATFPRVKRDSSVVSSWNKHYSTQNNQRYQSVSVNLVVEMTKKYKR